MTLALLVMGGFKGMGVLEASSDQPLQTATRLIQLSQQLNALIDSRPSA